MALGKLGIGFGRGGAIGVSGLVAPSGYVFLIDIDGAYLVDIDGSYLMEVL